MDYNLYNFLVRAFIFIYGFVGMVSYTRATREGEDNIINYDVSANHLWCNIVFNKKKVRKSGFQTGSILSVGPKKRTKQLLRSFFIHCESNGISSTTVFVVVSHQSVRTVYHHAPACIYNLSQ